MKKFLSRADGSVEMVYKKVPDTSHAFTTKMTIKSSAKVGHLKPILPWGRESSKVRGGGGCWIFELIDALL